MKLNMTTTRKARGYGRAMTAVAAMTGFLLLASCGGGGLKANNFRASRVLAFGDETSLLDDTTIPGNGQKYSVNGTVSDTDLTFNCANNPLWIQTIAASYGLVFAQCNIAANGLIVAAPESRIRATFGARVADFTAQVNLQASDSPFRSTDLATVMVGQYDVIAQYQQYPSVGEPTLIANVEAAGAELGRQVNRLADAGVKVVVSTTVDVGLTPYGINEAATHVDTDRAALLSRLSTRFNATMRATIYNDGKRIGLVLMDEFTQTVSKFPSTGGYSDVVTPVCNLSLSTLAPPSSLDCINATLIPNGSSVTYLWADGLHLSAGGQGSLGNLASARALNNPF